MQVVFEERFVKPLISAYKSGALFVVFWRGTPTSEAVEALDRELRTWNERVVFLAVVCAGTGLPNALVRSAMERSIKDIETRVSAAIVMIEESGFTGAAIRGMMTGIQMIMRPAYPMTIIATFEEAAKIIEKRWRAFDPNAPLAAELGQALKKIPR